MSVGGEVEVVVMEGLVIVRLRFVGVTARSSDGRDTDGGAFDEDKEPALERGTAEMGRAVSSREKIERSSPFHWSPHWCTFCTRGQYLDSGCMVNGEGRTLVQYTQREYPSSPPPSTAK